ncbi:glycerate kinase [Mycolicibacterium sp. XJ879]
MKIVLAPDSFKESMSASQAVAAMRAGVHAVFPDAECLGVPMADGGEGTVDAVIDALHGQRVEATVADALGRPVTAGYGYVPLRQLAVIEIAAAAGLELIPPDQRDILRASTFGVGELIRSALDRGAEDILIGLGGSATNDGGAGMLVALGAVLTDADGSPLEPGGAALERLERIDVSGLDQRLRDARIRVASDVTAPLLGPTGASAVFGPQKGAGPADVARLGTALSRLAAVTATTLGHVQPQRAGAGAAGGLGFALAEYLGAEIYPGAEEVARTVGLEQALRDADWVFTGEGSVDAQTVMGKTPFGVAQLAVKAGARVVIFAGRVAPDAAVLLDYGVDRLVAITAEGTPLQQALRDGHAALIRATEQFCRELAG